MYDDNDGGEFSALCKGALFELFKEYKRIHLDQHIKSSSSQPSHSCSAGTQSSHYVGLFGNSDDAIR